ncbi:MAG: biotin synthase BioB [Candidatus Omnitrophica bacterium]|nr:biotin synthase BioB [Candidatus Omnitrophota bacterium]
MRKFIKVLAEEIIGGKDLSLKEAEDLISLKGCDLPLLLEAAARVCQHFRANKVNLCSITNAKSGACSQDCKFCAQSAAYKTDVPVYPLIEPQEMLRRAGLAHESFSKRFCFVTSGESLGEDEFDKICEGLHLIKSRFSDLKLDASLGFLTQGRAKRLKQTGLSRYNHNLETSSDYFPKICSTHTYLKRVETVQAVKEAGLEVCCGGIFGLGESQQDRLKLSLALRDLEVDCIPLNFLNPISATPLGHQKKLTYKECLKIISIFRLVHPRREIKVCGGRESVLGNKQSLIFKAGADSIIFGDYLTTKGNSPNQDLEMIKAAGLSI